METFLSCAGMWTEGSCLRGRIGGSKAAQDEAVQSDKSERECGGDQHGIPEQGDNHDDGRRCLLSRLPSNHLRCFCIGWHRGRQKILDLVNSNKSYENVLLRLKLPFLRFQRNGLRSKIDTSVAVSSVEQTMTIWMCRRMKFQRRKSPTTWWLLQMLPWRKNRPKECWSFVWTCLGPWHLLLQCLNCKVSPFISIVLSFLSIPAKQLLRRKKHMQN